MNCPPRAAALLFFMVACSEGSAPPAAPDVPTSFVAEAVGARTIRLSWAYAGEVDGFRIDRRHVSSQGPTEFSTLTTVDGTARTYVDDNLDLARQYDYRLRACRGDVCSATTMIVNASTQNAARTFEDRADDISGNQVRIMYVVPSDGSDRALDTDGTLARSVASFHTWFQQKSGGYTIRFDRHAGELDIGFVRLKESDAYMVLRGAFVVMEIERLMAEENLLADGKLYIVYYDGSSSYACGGAAWPPTLPGQVAAMYLHGRPAGGSCEVPFVPSAQSPPSYWEFAALHDLLHTFGIVSSSAPNHTDAYPAHVPEPNDLMYTGPAPWAIGNTMTIDIGGDDYFGDDVAVSLPALDRTPYVTAPLAAAVAPRSLLAPMTPEHAAALRDALSRLPMHPPYPRSR